MRVASLFIVLSCFFSACIEDQQTIPEEVIGLAPIYALEDWQSIRITAPQNIENLGKIYYKRPYIYATERGRGIHIINNTDPLHPTPEAFLQIAGNSDLSIKDSLLYANNVNDLVSINISVLDDLKVVSRLEGVFAVTGSDFPEGYIGFFECADPELGQVVGWYETTLHHPQCWR